MYICVYGASSTEIDKIYVKKAEELGELMAKRGHNLVFGAGANGLMGATARGVLSQGNEIIGVAPTFFNADGIIFDKCTEFIPTITMRERKQIMEDKADAFVVLPGGIGTYEEYFEILTLKQLGRHNKPIVIYNINNYYDKMLAFLEKTADEKFMTEKSLELSMISDNPDEILDYIENYSDKQYEIQELKSILKSE